MKSIQKDLKSLKSHVAKFTLENVEEETGISAERVLELGENNNIMGKRYHSGGQWVLIKVIKQ